jgi:hypothetical protein
MPDGGPLIPQWLALTAGSITLLAVAAHLLSLNHATDIDPRRRRIRMTNAVLMMLAIPFIAYGFGIATPSRGRAYVFVWAITAGLLLMIILVALIDMLHSWQLHRAQLRNVRRQIAISRGLEARAASILAATRPPDETPPDARR